MRRLSVFLLAIVFLAPCALWAQDDEDDPDVVDDGVFLDISAELKANYRWSESDRFPVFTPFPPEFVPQGQDNVALATVAPGSSLEVSKAIVYFDLELPRQISGRIKIDFIDLYDRNPTSTDKKIDVDEAWIAFGPRQQSLQPIDGSSFYHRRPRGPDGALPGHPACLSLLPSGQRLDRAADLHHAERALGLAEVRLRAAHDHHRPPRPDARVHPQQHRREAHHQARRVPGDAAAVLLTKIVSVRATSSSGRRGGEGRGRSPLESPWRRGRRPPPA
jgi:hypothetical protein